MIPMYQIITVLVLDTVIGYNKEERKYNFDVLLVFSVFHLGLLFLLYQIPNISN